jgi:hypothetical protein
MKRWFVRVMVFLLVGAIVNVAVARGCVHIWSPNWTSPEWSEVDWSRKWSSSGVRYSEGVTLCELRVGWPSQSFRASWLGGWRGAREVVFHVPGTRVVPAVSTIVQPIRPLWPGFAANTVFYTAILWMLFAASGTLRRRRRIKRELCPACAYPVGASDVCTECGMSLRPRQVPA